MPTVLATGGAGYIGSHVVAELLGAGWQVVILDDFSNADSGVPSRIATLGLGEAAVVAGDIRDAALLDGIFRDHRPDAVVHLAGLKAVGELVELPLAYYDVNFGGATALLAAMQRHNVQRLVFSSSATVYGTPERNPIPEDAPIRATSPYGRTKLFTEALLDDLAVAWPDFASMSLRYFNPVGAHASGQIGENPRGVPNNLFPFIAQTAAGRRAQLRVFGNDYPTPDGTGVRDYIHVVDLARGHLAALEYLMQGEGRGRNLPLNLGCGRGYSVLEAVAAFGRASGREIPCEIVGRRPGDVAECVADPRRAEALLGWRATLGLDAMCADHWAFQSRLMPAD
ncbi:MAG: UDP-glucose 4-epimerase GalE [Amaricoccus sp.]|uniref:UDP-glucose 4-epimerase GalE n=1 Tax=Amaricoccus sp. TaxID=1872485 RepID=UPI0039E52883